MARYGLGAEVMSCGGGGWLCMHQRVRCRGFTLGVGTQSGRLRKRPSTNVRSELGASAGPLHPTSAKPSHLAPTLGRLSASPFSQPSLAMAVPRQTCCEDDQGPQAQAHPQANGQRGRRRGGPIWERAPEFEHAHNGRQASYGTGGRTTQFVKRGLDPPFSAYIVPSPEPTRITPAAPMAGDPEILPLVAKVHLTAPVAPSIAYSCLS